jgi:hypothetical protein
MKVVPMLKHITKKRSHLQTHSEVENFLIALSTIQKSTPGVKDRPSIERFVLENGMYFKPAPLPKGIPHGDVHNCFENAFVLAVKNKEKYFYCEGYASTGLLPTLHAWVVDSKSRVLDPTWAPDGTNKRMEYYGIPFDWDYITKQFKNMKHFGIIDDSKRGWPLLTGKIKNYKSGMRKITKKKEVTL